MTISVRCRRCDRALKVKDDYAGQTVKCPGCQSALKVPALEEELDDFDEVVEEDIPRRKSKRKSSSGELPAWVGYLKRFWFLAVPIIVIPVAFFHRAAFLPLGLGTVAVGVLYMIVGFIPAILVAPVYSLVPLVRMMTPQKERERIWKEQAPHYAVFGKGLLIVACGVASLFVSSKVQNWKADLGWNDRRENIPNAPDFPRPPQADPRGFAPANTGSSHVAGQPSLPSADGPTPFSSPTTPTLPAPQGNSDAAAAPEMNRERPPLTHAIPGLAVMVNQSGKWTAARVDAIYPNKTADVTLVTRQVVRGVKFSEMSLMTPLDSDMSSASASVPSPIPNPPQTFPGTPVPPPQLSAQDFQLNIEAQNAFALRFNGSAKVGDTMVLEVIGYPLGTCFGGQDAIYSTDTSIYVAAVHAGLLKNGERGRITVTMVNPLPSYPSLTQNGVTSSSWPDTWPAIQISKAK